jgi:Ca2+-binding RTX toxin-like protein
MGNDTLIGARGSDWIYGESGVDSILGGQGSDHIYGDANPVAAQFARDYSLFVQSSQEVLNGTTIKWLATKYDPNGTNDLYYITSTGELFHHETVTAGGSQILDSLVQVYDPSYFDNTRKLEIERGLYEYGLYYNWGLRDEKWFEGVGDSYENRFYFITPAGEVIHWDGLMELGPDPSTGELLTTLDFAYHADPRELVAAAVDDGAADFLNGQGGDDSIEGGDGNDILGGADGKDTLIGGNGSDVIYGGINDDELIGCHFLNGVETGNQNDTLYGGSGNDGLYGGDGDDFMVGQDGSDFLKGDDDHDTLIGCFYGSVSEFNGANDTIWGGAGNDVLNGGDGADEMLGDDDDDTLTGGSGLNTLIGGNGSDRLSGGNDSDLMYGGHRESADESGVPNDTLVGHAGSDWLYGGDGDDELRGRDGDDWLWGEDGNDVLYGDNNNDFLDGGRNDDVLRGGWGHDQLVGGEDLDRLYGENGNDNLFGAAWQNNYSYQDADNFLYGHSGNDNLYGGNGNDFLDGGEHGDGLFGGLGVNSLFGSSGADRFLVRAGETVRDVNAEDALLQFATGGTKTNDGNIYTGQDWTDNEIYRLDQALNVLHNQAGDRLLETSTGGMMTLNRYTGGARGFNDGTINLTDMMFDRGDEWLWGYTLHEIGHFWNGNQIGATRWTNFLRQSDWRSSNPLNRAYTDAGGGWWYRTDAAFASDYARSSPNEDFAESFAAFFMAKAGWSFYHNDVGDDAIVGAAAIPGKIAILQNWINGV